MKPKQLISLNVLLFMIVLAGCAPLKVGSIEEEAKALIYDWGAYMKENNADKVADLYSDPYTYVEMEWEPDIRFVEITESSAVLRQELRDIFSEMSCSRCEITINDVVADDTTASVEAFLDLYIASEEGSYISRKKTVQWKMKKQGDALFIVYENMYLMASGF